MDILYIMEWRNESIEEAEMLMIRRKKMKLFEHLQTGKKQ